MTNVKLLMRASETGVKTKFVTREQQLAEQDQSAQPYLRLEDPLCRYFLSAGTTELEFRSVEILFPFVREASVLQIPRHLKLLNDWMYQAFFSGYDLGIQHPELQSEVLPDHELRHSLQRLQILRGFAGCPSASGAALERAFSCVIEQQQGTIRPDRQDENFAVMTLKSLRAGYAAATVRFLDPESEDFYEVIPPDVRLQFSNQLWQHCLIAPAEAVGVNLYERLEHPLVRLTPRISSKRPTECALFQNFLREQLGAFGVTSENEVRASDLDLIEWITHAINYGKRVRREQPKLLEQIFREAEEKERQDFINAMRTVLSGLDAVQPLTLLPAFKRWQRDFFEIGEPGFYGEELLRVALFVHFAIWIPWSEWRPSRVRSRARRKCRGLRNERQLELPLEISRTERESVNRNILYRN